MRETSPKVRTRARAKNWRTRTSRALKALGGGVDFIVFDSLADMNATPPCEALQVDESPRGPYKHPQLNRHLSPPVSKASTIPSDGKLLLVDPTSFSSRCEIAAVGVPLTQIRPTPPTVLKEEPRGECLQQERPTLPPLFSVVGEEYRNGIPPVRHASTSCMVKREKMLDKFKLSFDFPGRTAVARGGLAPKVPPMAGSFPGSRLTSLRAVTRPLYPPLPHHTIHCAAPRRPPEQRDQSTLHVPPSTLARHAPQTHPSPPVVTISECPPVRVPPHEFVSPCDGQYRKIKFKAMVYKHHRWTAVTGTDNPRRPQPGTPLDLAPLTDKPLAPVFRAPLLVHGVHPPNMPMVTVALPESESGFCHTFEIVTPAAFEKVAENKDLSHKGSPCRRAGLRKTSLQSRTDL
ncbi:hypothetical protein BC628DRAFT_580207 [Trametes gibbosa]|nr:hypothetical protein BC628DRAFT_580207 [Trametes gibbosa]